MMLFICLFICFIWVWVYKDSCLISFLLVDFSCYWFYLNYFVDFVRLRLVYFYFMCLYLLYFIWFCRLMNRYFIL